MKRTSTVLLVILVALAIAACQRKNPQPTASQAAPAEASSTAEVVKVVGHFVPKAAGPAANVEVEISPGYHVNANPATYPYLIATEVQPGKVEGITIGKITYPAGFAQKFAFAEQPLSVYEGKVTIAIPFTVAADVKGQRTLPLKLRVQACDTEKCLPPATLDSAIAIDVDALHQ